MMMILSHSSISRRFRQRPNVFHVTLILLSTFANTAAASFIVSSTRERCTVSRIFLLDRQKFTLSAVSPDSSLSSSSSSPSTGLPKSSFTRMSTSRCVSSMQDPPVAATATGSKSSTSTKSTTTTRPAAKYPTRRGESVDSRKIIATGAGRQYLTAVRLQHILFATQEMAQSSLHLLRNGGANNNTGGDPITASSSSSSSSSSPNIVSFEELARSVSDCEVTRDKGGEIGWVSVPKNSHRQSDSWNPDDDDDDEDDDTTTIDEHLDHILPREARQQVFQISTKPGDVISIQSIRGYHLVQIVDIMANVRKMATMTRLRKQQRASSSMDDDPKKKKSGILAGILNGEGENDRTCSNKQLDLTYDIQTMGCQMNMADSERIEGQLQSLGIRPLTSVDEDNDVDTATTTTTTSGSKKRKKKRDRPLPDVVVLNTCSIRDHAEQKVYSYLGPHAKRKRQGEDVTIVVAGCVAQQEGESLLRRAPEVDLVMGPQYANRLGDLLEDVSNGNQVVATEATHIMEDSTKPRRQSTVCGWVNVIYGCNERCTFCIVPTTRGVEQSRPVESIVREVSDLVSQGYKEVTLLGQNIDAFGRDQVPKRKFSDLIRIVGSIDGLERLRFVTSHPRYMSLGVVDSVAETPAACESFHIPFQSGSNEVLIAMGRGHSREKYLHIVDRIRKRIPDASITADAIVGFPGETEEQFQETLSLMDEVVFDSVNTAAYSPRPNTPAADWGNQVPDDVKQDRLQRINALNKQHATQRRARMVGRTVEILVEERNIRGAGGAQQVVGRSRHGYIVYCPGDIEELRGRLVNVKIETSQTYYLTGKIVD